MTGNGLKDPAIALETAAIEPVVLPNDERAVLERLQGVVRT
ncbi:Threonine synthase [Geobacillus stearothermophilus]|uniref:Threonine synthase n=1 Tax=Geobacillus stearothermophilus TaxID=1422 RepID=A0A150MF15_GEOSE|nr:Threonine synthase [Geobacillus stearothermophilus]